MNAAHPLDPTGIIREAYQIEGISLEECRGIFFDWAIGHRAASQDGADIAALLDAYGAEAPDHPMTQVLREGVAGASKPAGRRGGARARRRD